MPMDHAFFTKTDPVITAPSLALHENALQFNIGPGEYVVVLSTALPHLEGQFLARMIVEKKRLQNR
jgi:Calpain large subunit, domain III